MEEIEYLHWEDLYQNTWENDYRSIISIKERQSLPEKELYLHLIDFYKSTLFLILTYLRNCGYYFNQNTMILRTAFRIGLIEDGESFMLINDMLAHPKKYNKSEILHYCLVEGFHVFDKLDKKMKEFLKQK